MNAAGSARGVGAVLNRGLAEFLATHPAALDYVELLPEMLWTDHGPGAPQRFVDDPAARDLVDALAGQYPLVCHGVGLSIGNALPLDEEHLAQVARTAARYGVSRCSETLGLPARCAEATLDWLVPRLRHAGEVLGLPLLLANGVHRRPAAEQGLSEPQLLNRLAAATGCGVVLDLHNLYTDLRNGTGSPVDYLAELDLRLVREIHLAGTDTPANACPPPVLALLRQLVPACPQLEGISCAFHADARDLLSADSLQAELGLLAEAWGLRQRR